MLTAIGTKGDDQRLTGSMRFSRRLRSKVRKLVLIPTSCVLLAVLGLTAIAVAQEHVNSEGEQLLVSLINQERAKVGVPPVKFDEALARAARKHSQLMAQEETVVHQLPGEEVFSLRLSAENVRSDRDAENIGMAGSLEEIHSLLMQSPPHRENILNPQYDSVGIGIAQSGVLIFVTEDFAHVLPLYSEIEADAAAQASITEYAKSQGLQLPVRRQHIDLTNMACEMAREDKIDAAAAQGLPGVRNSVAWTASDLGHLPTGVKKALASPMRSEYSLGVCFAPSVSHPGGLYWLLMVFY